MAKVGDRLTDIEARLASLEDRLMPTGLTTPDGRRERSRIIHANRGEAWPCTECFPADVEAV